MKQTSLPVFPNWYPFNDMVLDGHMKVGKYDGVKTRSWDWAYRGPLFFYNSGRTAKSAVSSYGYSDAPSKHGVIIGVGELVDVRKLKSAEALRMVCNFNNLTAREVKGIIRKAWEDDDNYKLSWAYHTFYQFGNFIAPLDTGFFFKNLVRFTDPVPFNWPAGPVKPISTKITPGSLLARQLKVAGF